MEKMKFNLLCCILCFQFVVNAQEKTIIRKGLLSVQATISPAYMFGDKESYFYLHGGLEAFVDNRLSLTGDLFYQLGSFAENNNFDYNHSLVFGAAKHFTQRNNDFYIGLQPGISITKLNALENGLIQSHSGVNPIFSPVIGYQFFVNKVFHFFVQTRLVVGQHNYDRSKNLAEVRLSAGLGFNLNSMK